MLVGTWGTFEACLTVDPEFRVCSVCPKSKTLMSLNPLTPTRVCTCCGGHLAGRSNGPGADVCSRLYDAPRKQQQWESSESQGFGFKGLGGWGLGSSRLGFGAAQGFSGSGFRAWGLGFRLARACRAFFGPVYWRL